jgi:hypothetical protein
MALFKPQTSLDAKSQANTRHLSRHANALTQRRGGVDSFADVYAICTQLDGQHYLADHVASIQKRRAFSWAGYRSR